MKSINLNKDLNLILIPTAFEASFIKEEEKENFILLKNSKIGLKTSKNLDALIKNFNININNVILLGFAGVLNKTILNKPYSINKCIYNNNINEININKNLNYEEKSILTVKKPIHSETRKQSIKVDADLVDMETYFLSLYCIANKLNFYSIRVALDNCDTNLIDIFKNKTKTPDNIKEAGIILNNSYKTILQQF